MFFHVFAHIEAEKGDAEVFGQLPGHLGFADAGGTGEQKGTDRFFRMAEAGAAPHDRLVENMDGSVLAEDDLAQIPRQMLQFEPFRPGDGAHRDARHAADDRFDIFQADDLFLPVMDAGEGTASSMTSMALSGRKR